MKKDILHFPPTRKGYLPKFSSRRFCGKELSFRSSAYKEDGETEEEKRTALLAKIQEKIDAGLATRATKEELEAIRTSQSDALKDVPLEALRAMADDKTGVMAKLAEQGLEITRLRAEMKTNEAPKDMSVRGQIKAWIESKPKELGGTRSVKDVIEDIKSGIKTQLPSLELRVASPMLVSTVNGGSSPYIGRTEMEAGINAILRYPNTFWDTITKGRTGASTYVWANMVNEDGAAAFIGPGVAKPGISFELAAETSIAKKIAASAKAGTELLQDIDGMTTFIEQELQELLMLKVNEKLMTGVSSTTVPAGIQTLSQVFSFYTAAAAGIKTTNPTHMDAIRAAVGALRSGKLTGEITVFVNSIDAANMDLSKAVDSGVYLLPPFTTSNGQVIAGARIVEDQNIAVGYFQAAFLRYYRVLIYKDYTVQWGWENDDFTKNLVTAIGEMRLHQFLNSIHTGFALYDTFVNVKTAITEV